MFFLFFKIQSPWQIFYGIMHIVQIFIVTVPLVIIYVYQFMVLLRSNLKNIFFPVYKVFTGKAIVCLQPVIVSRIVIRLIPM